MTRMVYFFRYRCSFPPLGSFNPTPTLASQIQVTVSGMLREADNSGGFTCIELLSGREYRSDTSTCEAHMSVDPTDLIVDE